MTKRMLTAVLTVALTLSLTACGGGQQQEMGETRTVYTMDTVMNLTAYGENASAALDAAEETLRTLDAKLDRHDETSTVSALNRDGTVEDAELAQLTDIAQTIGALSGGAFDPTVAPVMDAWDFTGDAPRVPSDEELSALLAHVGLEKLSVDGNTVTLSDGAQLDLGGIAKGYAAGRVRTILREAGVTSAIISLGGNVAAVGKKPDGSAWTVGLQDPDNPEAYFGTVSIEDACVVTSGAYQRYFEENGVRYHHILDPHTGCSAESGVKSVSVVAQDDTLADALSTALFVMGLDAGAELWNSSGLSFEAVFVTDDNTVWITPGLAGRYRSDRSYQILE